MSDLKNLKVFFCLNPVYDDNNSIFTLKISGEDFWELNIQVNQNELQLFHKIKESRWETQSLKIGKCLGSPTFWSCENGVLSILVGNDELVWDFCVLMNESVIEDLLREIEI